MTRVDFQPVQVAVPGGDVARLAFVEGKLTAVLVRLSENFGDDAGRWFLEAGFGLLDGVSHPTFADLDEAAVWIADRLARAGGPPA